ncbi:hypothetical protein MIND_01121200 [Mycena indigotica]|uniref:Uncharacterized protein n=1 Tax=Mycena indigotica TaxID=2126181 RepID=A0A8H6S6Z1_9AGAR|nr:uncharacterized protein MIND_01121200 [Mycena indigotica]KAF7293438.1 hypothetical protein MIND_01121200 [Mycena indigotica]
MPKTQHKCDLCGKPLRNLADAKRVYDRTCPGFRALHIQSVAHIRPHLPPPLPPVEVQVEETPPEPLKYRSSGLPDRHRKAPARLNDAAPAPPPRVRRQQRANMSAVSMAPAPTPASTEPKAPRTYIQTEPNAYGLYKVYPRRPTHDPDDGLTIVDLYQVPLPTQSSLNELLPPPEPCITSRKRARVLLLALIDLSKTSFDPTQKPNRTASTYTISRFPFQPKKFLDDLDKKGIEPLGVNEKWIQGSVLLKLPCAGRKQKEIDAPEFTITDIHYRPLLDPIREVLQGPLFKNFHTTLRFDPTFDPNQSTSPDIPLDEHNPRLNGHGLPELPPHHEEVFGEIYTSAAMLEAYHSIPQPPPPQSPDDPIESIVVALMEWSNATHLAQFGTASLWPCYTFFGNHPKAYRGKPSLNAGFHQAYFTTLPNSIRDAYRKEYGQDMSDDVYRHLKRELMHRIWDLLLSEDFMDAYDNGIKIRCWDGIVRLIFPRFFIYGADYPEKVLLATI